MSLAREPLHYSAAAVTLVTEYGQTQPSNVLTMLSTVDTPSTNPAITLTLPADTIAIRVTISDNFGVATTLDVAVQSTEAAAQVSQGASCFVKPASYFNTARIGASTKCSFITVDDCIFGRHSVQQRSYCQHIA